jgi:hypothetical protein
MAGEYLNVCALRELLKNGTSSLSLTGRSALDPIFSAEKACLKAFELTII